MLNKQLPLFMAEMAIAILAFTTGVNNLSACSNHPLAPIFLVSYGIYAFCIYQLHHSHRRPPTSPTILLVQKHTGGSPSKHLQPSLVPHWAPCRHPAHQDVIWQQGLWPRHRNILPRPSLLLHPSFSGIISVDSAERRWVDGRWTRVLNIYHHIVNTTSNILNIVNK